MPLVREFRHEALLYSRPDEFVEAVAAFVADGLVRGEPAVIAVSAEKIDALRSVLGDQKGLCFADMDAIGRNPACLIPLYHGFIVDHAGGGPCRGVGEPVGPHRRGAELTECEIHEYLCNLAFATTRWWVLCPYDTSALDRDVIERASRTHPVLVEGGRRRASPAYRPVPGSGPLGDPLPEPPAGAHRMAFAVDRLPEVRPFVALHAYALGLDAERTADLVLAVDTVVTDSVRAAGGDGVLAVWREGSRVIAEVRDRRRLTDPLVGREPPGTRVDAGGALWAANRLCDLLQVRSGPTGTTVRLHVTAARNAAPGPLPAGGEGPGQA